MKRVVIVVFSLFWAFSAPALACSCPDVGAPAEHIANTDVIVLGTFTLTRLKSQKEWAYPETLPPFEPNAIGDMKVWASIKGSEKDVILTVHFDTGSSCWVPASVGSDYIFFLNRFESDYLYSTCANQSFWGKDNRDEYINSFKEMTGEDFSDFRYPKDRGE